VFSSGKEQRKTLNAGISEMNDLDDALLIGLNAEVDTRPEMGKAARVVMITPDIGQVMCLNNALGIDCTEDIDSTIEQIKTFEAGTIVSSFGRGVDGLSNEEKKRYFRCLNDQSKSGRSVLHLTRQWPVDEGELGQRQSRRKIRMVSYVRRLKFRVQ